MDAELALAPRPELVRTARLVAGAAARRAGVHEDVVDEVRLAVGEAAARAVVRHQRAGSADPVVVRWEATGTTFTVEVADAVTGGDDVRAPGAAGEDATGAAGDDDGAAGDDDGADALAVAVIEALVPDASLMGSVLRMGWPLADVDAGTVD